MQSNQSDPFYYTVSDRLVPYRCSTCGQTCYGRDALEEHYRTFHAPNRQPYPW